MPTIRALAIAALSGGVFIVFMILAVGGVASNNGVVLPGGLASNYTKLSGNQTTNTVVAGISPLQASVRSGYSTTANQTFISGTVGSVTVMTTVFNALSSIWNSYIVFIDGGLTVVHISTQYATLIAVASIILMLALSVVSAVMLFPV